MTHQMTAAGLQTDDLETIVDEIVDAFHATISPVADLSDSTPMGSFIRLLAERESSVVEAIEEVYAGSYPSTAYGFSLDLISALTGCYRQEATKSTLASTEADVQLNAATTLPAGSVAHVAGNPEARFVTRVAVTNGGGAPAWIPCAFEAEDTGPIQCLSGTLDTIAEPVAGWTDVRSTADATLGENEEEDSPFRVRRVIELAQGGSTTAIAIRAEVSALEGMRHVIVQHNPYDRVDNYGLAPHSVHVIVYDGTDRFDVVHNVEDDDIIASIWGVVSAGIIPFGNEQYTYTDSEDNEHPVGFTRALEVDIYIDIDISGTDDYDPDEYPGDAALKAAIATWGNANHAQDDDVIYFQVASAVLDVAGISDATSLTIGFAPAPAGTVNLVIQSVEIAIFDTANITVTS